MSSSIEEALSDCLGRIETGETTLEEELSLYPELRAELEPLLSIAAELRAIPKVEAPASLRGYKRPVFRSPASKIQPRESWWRRFVPLGAPSSGWATPLIRIAAALLIVAAATSGTIIASANSLPNEPLFPVKLAIENAQLAVAPNAQARVGLELQFAANRVSEVQSAAQQDNPAAVAQGVALYEQSVNAAIKASEAASQAAPNAPEKVQESLRQNVQVLTKVQEKVQNPQAKTAIGAAILRAQAASAGEESGRDKGGEAPAGAVAGPAAAASFSPTVTATPALAAHEPTATSVAASGRSGETSGVGNPNRGDSAAAKGQGNSNADGASTSGDNSNRQQKGQGMTPASAGEGESRGLAAPSATATRSDVLPSTARPIPSPTSTATPNPSTAAPDTAAPATPSATATPVLPSRDGSGTGDRAHQGDPGMPGPHD